MGSSKSKNWWNETDYLVPDLVVTREGITIRTSDSVWRINLNDSVNWGLVSSLPNQLLLPIRAYICHVLVSKSGSTARVVFGRIARLISKIDRSKLESEVGERIGAGLFYLLKQSLENDPETGESTTLDTLSEFRRWYLWCVDCEFPGFDEESALELSDKVIGGSPQGLFVLQCDPEFGPLTFAEDTRLEAALSRANDCPEESATNWLQASVAVMLSKAFGLYAGHLQLLNEADLVRELMSDGGETYWLKVPRLKKRGSRGRVGTRRRRLTPRMARAIKELIDRNANVSPRTAATEASGDSRPMFTRATDRRGLAGTGLEADARRWGKNDFGMAMSEFCSSSGIEFRISPRRLRYSFATRLVEEGCSPMELADALDHTDLQHVMVYFNSRGRVVRQLDEALAIRLAPLANAFLGRVIPGAREATRANDPASTIRFGVDSGSHPDVGSCGTVQGCGLNVPLACYTCARFEPWVDAPHQEVLATLVSRRRRRHLAGLDEKLVQVHDATILAVAEVIRRSGGKPNCEQT
jgi:integrase